MIYFGKSSRIFLQYLKEKNNAQHSQLAVTQIVIHNLPMKKNAKFFILPTLEQSVGLEK